MRRPRRDDQRLLARLAVTPVADDDGPPRIGLVYGGFGVVSVAALGLMFVIQDGGTARWLLYALIAVVVAWCVVAFAWALPQAFGGAHRALQPLGLRVMAKPTYVPNVAVGGGRLDGAIVYGGDRHGRQVEIRHTPAEALTVVSFPSSGPSAATAVTSSSDMARLTGEPEATWKHVLVEVGPRHVAVRRRRNGAGGWMLHDLLLAEAVADRR